MIQQTVIAIGKEQLWVSYSASTGFKKASGKLQGALYHRFNESAFMFGKHDLLLRNPRFLPELCSRIVKGLEACYKIAVGTYSNNAECL